MDTLELLELESRTTWGWTDGRLADNTIAATAISVDGRSLAIPGEKKLAPTETITVSISRCWLLKATGPPNELPAGLRLITAPVQLQPPDGWTAEQWAELMSGNHGPWAAIIDSDRVVSLAHCARLTTRAAEVGVETNEDHRSRGLAAIAVKAWVEQLADQDLITFYSAAEDNTASHRVAQKCRATPLGHLIQITAAATAD